MRIERTLEAGGIARVHLVRLREEPWGAVECVGALDPAVPVTEKIVLVVSSQYGCPVGCPMCDAGRGFHGNLEAKDIFAQIDFLMESWAGPAARRCPKLKIQFARMGEPSLNPAVLEVVSALPRRYGIPGIMPCIATTAPKGSMEWFERLADIKDGLFGSGMFQLQFSVQSTSEAGRGRLIPYPVTSLSGLSRLCERFVRPGDRRAVLNFAAVEGAPIEPGVLRDVFDPARSLVKLTPLNPTGRSAASGLSTMFRSGVEPEVADLVSALEEAGFDVIVSVGLEAESEAGTSCGQLAFAGSGAPERFQKS
ncbi:radical SAM protein [Candidatus Fermentibacteria bacterium]|nr:radical SAM protein [Candidatus Fermentibacteria bacterium]